MNLFTSQIDKQFCTMYVLYVACQHTVVLLLNIALHLYACYTSSYEMRTEWRRILPIKMENLVYPLQQVFPEKFSETNSCLTLYILPLFLKQWSCMKLVENSCTLIPTTHYTHLKFGLLSTLFLQLSLQYLLMVSQSLYPRFKLINPVYVNCFLSMKW